MSRFLQPLGLSEKSFSTHFSNSENSENNLSDTKCFNCEFYVLEAFLGRAHFSMPKVCKNTHTYTQAIFSFFVALDFIH